MASVDSVIFNRLTTATAINTAVKGAVYPEWRDDICPAICYELDPQKVEDPYEGIGPVTYELTVSVIGSSFAFSVETADLVISRLRNTSWTDSPYVVLGCDYESQSKDYIDTDTKNKRLAVVDCRFTITIR